MDSDILKSNTILVTGTAGFIGFHLAKKLLERGDTVIGIDNINDYYDVNLKLDRLADTGISEDCLDWHKPAKSEIYPNYTFVRMNLEDREELFQLFKDYNIDKVCNLAAQAGVRYSIENPFAYIDSNIVGFINILEVSRHNNIKHLVYASSSSVYGNNSKMPLSTNDNVDHPISLYAATKKSNELMAHAYSHLYGLPTTGLRFFTVYGPWGRPDMALFLFTKAIMEDKPIMVFNNGNMVRDFTFIDDIIEGVVRVIDNPAIKANDDNIEPSRSKTAPYKVYNIGNSTPVQLMDYINAIEIGLEKKAIKEYLPIQPGDVPMTNADVKDLIVDLEYKPNTKIEEGVSRFAEWYLNYYK
jgi:UDP-glucuronate 4-epimerase